MWAYIPARYNMIRSNIRCCNVTITFSLKIQILENTFRPIYNSTLNINGTAVPYICH